jgi:N-acetylglucosaminyl-diphospho-decaprenol L-rhamnosyltransferase
VSAGVCIVIPVYNQLHYTRLCLESLMPTIGEATVLVIDNASSDGTGEFLSNFKGISVISNQYNLGCSGAWNQGAKAASSEWVVILNNDVIVGPEWLSGLLSAANEYDLDIVSPAIREGEYNYDVSEYEKRITSKMSDVMRNGIASGICFMVRQTVFKKIGYFDENFKIGQFEDTDFFRRASVAGMRLAITGRSFLHHFGSVTQDAIRKKRTRKPYEIENRAYYHRKWNLKWYHRFLIRNKAKIQGKYWRLSELLRYGDTLKERWENGSLRYY